MIDPTPGAASVSDQTLMDLIHSKTPDELTLGEIEALRAALPHSPELQQALAQQLQMDQYLADALGRVRISVDEILSQAQYLAPSRGRTVPLSWVLGFAGVLVVGGLAVWFQAKQDSQPDHALNLAAATKADSLATPDAAQVEAATGAESADTGAAVAAPSDSNSTTSPASATESATATTSNDKPANPEDTSPAYVAAVPNTSPEKETVEVKADAPPVESKPAETPPASVAEVKVEATEVAPPERPSGPWDGKQHLGGELLTLDEAAYPGHYTIPEAKNLEQLRQWFEAVPGANYQLQIDAVQATLQGLARLKAPWAEQAVLRLELGHQQGFRIHVWNGKQGVTLFAKQPAPDATWAAAAITRAGQEALPKNYTLTATDGGRAWRTGENGPAGATRIDIRYQNGELIVARGDVRLLSAPLAGPPEAIYLEGRTLLRSLRLFRSVPLPADPVLERTEEQVLDSPAQAQWETSLPSGAKLARTAEGAVKLTSDEAQAVASAAWLLPPGGVREIIFEVSDFTSGGGVFLGDEKGQPLVVARFFKDKNSKTGQMALGYPPLADQTVETPLDFNSLIHGYADGRVFVRLLASSGRVRYWLSADGQHWAQVGQPQRVNVHDVRSLGIFCGPMKQPCGITLHRADVRGLRVIDDLAPPDLVRRAPVVLKDQLPLWLDRVMEAQPSSADPDQWRRACALRAMAAGGLSIPVFGQLSRQLLQDCWDQAGDLAAWQRVSAAMATLADTWSNPEGSLGWQLFEQEALKRGATLVAQGDARPFQTLLHLLICLPVWTGDSFKLPLADFARTDFMALVANQQWPEINSTARLLTTYGYLGQVPPNPLLVVVAHWAQASAAERGGIEPLEDQSGVLDSRWRHPLSIELSKEGFNVLAELEVALANRAYKDACQIVSSAHGAEAFGLLPSGKDNQLWSSFPLAVADTMRRIPDLQQTMREKFGAVGSLRVKESIAVGDAASLEMATVQFYGTPAAGLAHFWLGDRALSVGDFVRSLRHYRQAESAADPGIRRQLAAHRRLAEALVGEEWGEPVTQAISLGETQIPADKFEALIAEALLRQRPTAPAAPAAAPTAARHIRTSFSFVPAPAPTELTTEARGKLDQTAGPVIGLAQQSSQLTNLDWVARSFNGVVEQDLLYSTDGAVARAFNLASGQQIWQVNIVGAGGSAQQVGLFPLRPVLVDNWLILRRRLQQSFGIVAVQAATGQPVWQAEGQRDASIIHQAISDPLVIDDEVLALISEPEGRALKISLAAYDLQTGDLRRKPVIAHFSQAWLQYPSCSVIQAGDGVIALLGGSVFCLDPQGDVRWIRREPWLSPDIAPQWAARTVAQPLISGQHMYLTPIGSSGILCIDIISGKQLWRRPMLDARRAVGRAGEILVVETSAGFVGLNAETGDSVWEHAADQRLDGLYTAGPGGVAYSRRVAARESNQYHPQIVWLNPQTGTPTARTTLWQLKDPDPALGPFFAAASGTYVLFGHGVNQPVREVYSLLPGAAAGTVLGAPPLLSRWANEIPPRLMEAAAGVLPDWAVVSADSGPASGLVGEHVGRKQVLALKPIGTEPARLARWVEIPTKGKTTLSLEYAANPAGACILQVRVGDTTLWRRKVVGAETMGAWQQTTIDLTPYAGLSAWVQIQQPPTGQANDEAYWARAVLKSEP